MDVLDAGHDYLLVTLDGRGEQTRLTFVKRCDPGHKYPGNTNAHAGTTIQEVCRALIERVQYVNWQCPDARNDDNIARLREVIRSLEWRADERHGRPHGQYPDDIEHVIACRACGHLGCAGC